jgi:predicted protein tyrosine phosphatase
VSEQALASPPRGASPSAEARFANDDDGQGERDPESGGTSRRSAWRASLAVIAGIAVIGGGIAGWDAVKYRFIPKRFGVVVPGEIYRSGQISQYQFAPTIRKHGIDVVIDLNGVDPADVDQAAEIAAYETLGVENYRFKLEGNGTGVVENYVNAIATLAECHRAGKSVLVHCHAGTQRTGSVIAAYRVLVLGESPQAAYAELAQYGWSADSDQVLLLYLNGNMQRVAEELVARGIISRVPDPIPLVGP